jgi:hypothetical protein
METRGGILGHHFNIKLEYLDPCYSQSFILADFKENRTYKKIRESRKLESIHEYHFVDEGRKPDKTLSSEKTRVYA